MEALISPIIDLSLRMAVLDIGIRGHLIVPLPCFCGLHRLSQSILHQWGSTQIFHNMGSI